MLDKERVDLAYRRNLHKISLFRYDKLPKTANSMRTYMRQVKKSKALSFYEIDQIDLDLRKCIEEEFSESRVDGQEYRCQCFNDVNATFIKAMNTLDKNNADIITNIREFYDIADSKKWNIAPISRRLEVLIAKSYRSYNQELTKFHLSCYVYLVNVEGIFDELARALAVCVEGTNGRLSSFEELKEENIFEIMGACKQLYGVKPVFFKDWKDKNHIRNAIAHGQTAYNVQKQEGHFLSLIFDKSIQKYKPAYDKDLAFSKFYGYLCEIVDAGNSLIYSLYLHDFLMDLIAIARAQEKLTD
jgi:hypothetical protein